MLPVKWRPFCRRSNVLQVQYTLVSADEVVTKDVNNLLDYV